MKKSVVIILFAVALAALSVGGLRAASDKTSLSRNITIFNDLYKNLYLNYVDTVDVDKAMRRAVDAMLGGIDPYTVYYSLDEIDELKSLSSGEFGGIGSYIFKNGDFVELNEPHFGGPAYRAGLRAGDRLLMINNDTITEQTTSSEASAKLRGQPGTKIRLKVMRPYIGPDSILDFEFKREMIKVPTLPYYGIVSPGIGYINLATFNEHSASLVRDALLDLKKNNDLKGIILDLRDNGGGILEGAQQILGHFLDKGTEVLRTRGREASSEKIYKTTNKPVDTHIPLVVLTNGSTASSSEIVAGALQDLDRAVILGERSFGKGLVQSSRPIAYGGQMKITISRYYIPSGRLIQAIDYSHRNPDGSVARTPDSLTNVYRTRAGREVRDGGGITPDVKVDVPEINRLIYNVVADYWAYNFANKYANQNPDSPDAETFEVTDSIFDQFKAFIDPEKFKYDKYIESGLEMLREAAKTEGYMTDSVSAQFDVLAAMLKHDLDHDLEYNKKEIVKILDAELSKRYFNESEQVKRSLRDDPVIEAAIAVLNDPERYKSLLQPQK